MLTIGNKYEWLPRTCLGPLFYCIYISLTSSLIIGGVYYLGQNLDVDLSLLFNVVLQLETEFHLSNLESKKVYIKCQHSLLR